MAQFASLRAARLALILCLGFSPIVTSAQEQEQAPDDEGLSLMERGAKLFFEGIRREMDPALDDLRDLAQDMQPAMRRFVEEMGPALSRLLAQVDDLANYHAPEMLPNGDIILRRKQPMPPERLPVPEKGEGEIDL